MKAARDDVQMDPDVCMWCYIMIMNTELLYTDKKETKATNSCSTTRDVAGVAIIRYEFSHV